MPRRRGDPAGRAALPLLMLLLAAGATLADEPDERSESLFLAPMPEVLTATRLAQRQQDAPASIFVIDRDMIDASGMRDLEELLRLAPGFLVAHDGANAPAVGYHGLVDQYGRRMLVQIDGRAVYDPLFGGVRWSDLPLALDDVDRIEVVRGSNSATYGANAFLGVVNITTRRPAASQGLYLRAEGGDPRYRETVFRHGFRSGALDVRYTLGYAEDAGFTKNVDRPVIDSRQFTLATLDAVYDLDRHNELRFQGGVKQGELELGRTSSGVPDPTDPPREIPVTHGYLQAGWLHELSPSQSLSVTAYANHRTFDDRYAAVLSVPLPEPVGTLDEVLLGTDFDRRHTADRFALELVHSAQPVDTMRVAWGGELRRDRVASSSLFRDAGSVHDDLVRLFANLEWRPDSRVTLNAGGMFEHHSNVGNDFSPRLAINWHVNPRHTLRVSASRSVRAPSLFEDRVDAYDPIDIGVGALDGTPDAIYQEWSTNRDLESETVESYELGWLFDLAPRRGLTGDVRLFYERYRNLLFEYHYPLALRPGLALCDPVLNPLANELIPAVIDALERDRSPVPWTKDDGPACNIHPGFNNQAGLEGPESLSFANQVGLDVYGVETSIEWRPGHKLRLIGSYSIANTRNLEFKDPQLWDRDFTNRDGNWLTKLEDDFVHSVPSHVLGAMAIYRPLHDLTLSAMLYHVSKTDFLEDGDTGVPAYTRLDFRAAQRFRPGGAWHGELYLAVQNATRDYEDFEHKNIYETRVLLGLKLYQ